MNDVGARTLEVTRAASSGARAKPWRIGTPGQKLDARARLPGAFSYDQATHAMRIARAAGVDAADLLPAAFAASWLVNARTPSPTFKTWLEPPRRNAWSALLGATSVGAHGWRALAGEDRDAVATIVAGLSNREIRIAAISKVLACLCPEAVPLMDDHALVHVLEPVVPEPTDADNPVAEALHFVPMMDWFTQRVATHENELVGLARTHQPAILDAAQVLDRLLWFDSWGWRLTHRMSGVRYWCLRDGERETVVPIDVAPPAGLAVAPLDVATLTDGPFRDAARRALDAE